MRWSPLATGRASFTIIASSGWVVSGILLRFIIRRRIAQIILAATRCRRAISTLLRSTPATTRFCCARRRLFLVIGKLGAAINTELCSRPHRPPALPALHIVTSPSPDRPPVRHPSSRERGVPSEAVSPCHTCHKRYGQKLGLRHQGSNPLLSSGHVSRLMRSTPSQYSICVACPILGANTPTTIA